MATLLSTNQIRTPLRSGEAFARSNESIILAYDVFDYLTEAIDQVSAEVGGVGYVYETRSGDLFVDEVWMTPQVVSGASVDFKPEADALAIEKALEDDRLDDLRFSWHSHDNMGVFWSGTDEGGVRTRLHRGPMPYLVSLVGNKAGEWRGRIDAPVIGAPWMTQVTLDPVKIRVEKRRSQMSATVKEAIKENVDVRAMPLINIPGRPSSGWKGGGKKKPPKDFELADPMKFEIKVGQNIWVKPADMSPEEWRGLTYDDKVKKSVSREHPNATKSAPTPPGAYSGKGDDDDDFFDGDVPDLTGMSAEDFLEICKREGIEMEGIEILDHDPTNPSKSTDDKGADLTEYQPWELLVLEQAGYDLSTITQDEADTALLSVRTGASAED